MCLGNVEQLLGAVVGSGEKEMGHTLSDLDAYEFKSAEWQDVDACVKFLDAAQGLDAQIIYPTMGILWQGEVNDPALADALGRAYNRCAFQMCSGHQGRLIPAAYISLLDAELAVREMRRVAQLGGKTIFVASAPVNGHSFGHPDLETNLERPTGS